jgi:hypothetical protein
MQFTTSTFFFALTIASFPIATEGTFKFLFNNLFGGVVDQACDLAQSQLGLEEAFKCSCDLSYAGLFRGFDGNVDCTTTTERCLVPPSFYCASGGVGFALKAGIFVPTGLNSNITACFTVKSGLPADVASIDEICFEFSTVGLGFDKCSVTVGNAACKSCTICDTKRDFKFDCSNINLPVIKNSTFTLPGPNISDCIGFSSIPLPNVTSRV